MNNNEVYHSGTKNMKWGVRLWQNPDGTYTEQGKARRREEYKKSHEYNMNYDKQSDSYKYGKKYRVNPSVFKEGKDGKPSPAEKTARAGEDMVKTTSKLTDKAFTIANKTKNRKLMDSKNDEIGKMSDEELRRRINRLQMESSYKQLTGDGRKVSKGQTYAREFFEIAGSMAALAVSATQIMAIMQKAK